MYVEAEIEEEKGERGEWVRRVNGHSFARAIRDEACEFEGDGYEVVAVFPVAEGGWGSMADGGAGWSYTQGAIVVARKAD
jgi:hypothetical protein